MTIGWSRWKVQLKDGTRFEVNAFEVEKEGDSLSFCDERAKVICYANSVLYATKVE